MTSTEVGILVVHGYSIWSVSNCHFSYFLGGLGEEPPVGCPQSSGWFGGSHNEMHMG